MKTVEKKTRPPKMEVGKKKKERRKKQRGPSAKKEGFQKGGVPPRKHLPSEMGEVRGTVVCDTGELWTILDWWGNDRAETRKLSKKFLAIKP